MAHKIAVPTILVCDDSSETRLLLQTIFTSEGYAVFEAKDGLAAEETAISLQPDLIIIDVVMPRQDGITTIRQLKNNEKTAHIPVIVISGKASLTQLLSKEDQNIATVFKKPFHLNELKEKVAEILK